MLWPYHLERLERGLTALGIDCDRDRIDACLKRGLDYLADARMDHAAGRLVISRGPGGRGYGGEVVCYVA